MRLAFFGTPELAVPTLRALVEEGHEVELVVTGPDRRRGRGGTLSPTPVGAEARRLGLPITTEARDVIARRVDLGVVVAFGRLLSQALLDVVPVVNLHLSLLPRWRGAAPVERAILAGDLETGVSIMALEAGLDTGPVYVAIATQIDPEESATTLGHRLVALGTDELCTRLAGGIAGLGTPHPQVGVPTYAAKISADDRRLDFSADAIACHRVVRIGRATTTFRDAPFTVRRAAVTAGAPGGTRVGELVGDVVATASGGLRLLEVQVPGRRPQPFAEFARGARIAPGEVLGDPGTDRLPSSGLGGQG